MSQRLIFSLLFFIFPPSYYGKPQTRSIFELPQTKSNLPCLCQPWKDCTWSQNLVNQLAALTKDHQNYKPLTEQFKAQICDQKTRHVWCCGGSEKELKNATKTKPVEQETRTAMGKETPFSDL